MCVVILDTDRQGVRASFFQISPQTKTVHQKQMEDGLKRKTLLIQGSRAQIHHRCQGPAPSVRAVIHGNTNTYI